MSLDVFHAGSGQEIRQSHKLWKNPSIPTSFEVQHLVKVTFVIPTYNCAKYVTRAIDSCLEQTYKDFEIIVVDDGSTDGTREMLIDKYQGKNLPIMIHTKNNGGTASALNTGIKWAKGEFIHWLSADDMLRPEALEMILPEIEKRPDAKDCIFYTDYDYIDESDNIILQPFIEKRYPDQQALKADLWDHHLGNGSSSMIHRSIFDRIGIFDQDVKYCEDYEFWMRAALLFGLSLVLIPGVTLHYRIHSDQLTQTLGTKAAPFIKNCRKQVWLRMTEKQKAAYPYIE